MWGWISAVILGFISVSSFERDKLKQAVVFNSLCLLLLVFLILSQSQDLSIASIWVVAGLTISFVADFLRIQHKQSKFCFTAFLVVQLLYSKAFWMQLSGSMVWWLPALLIAASIVAFFLLLPQIDTLIFPVTVMGMMLIQMTWASGEVWLNHPSAASLMGFVGSIFFMVSAILLAIHDFRQPLRFGHSFIGGSYLLAQTLIVASVVL